MGRLALACERTRSRGARMLAVASHLMERDGRPLLASAQRGMTRTRGRGASARSGLEGLPLRKKSHEDFMHVFFFVQPAIARPYACSADQFLKLPWASQKHSPRNETCRRLGSIVVCACLLNSLVLPLLLWLPRPSPRQLWRWPARIMQSCFRHAKPSPLEGEA